MRGLRGAVVILATLAPVALALAAPPLAQAARGGHPGPPAMVEPARPPSATPDSLRVPEYSAEGVRTNGRIFGYDPREGSYSCSGTAINTPSRSIVLTAGHCVLEAGSTGRDLAFIPAYDHGNRPYGTFTEEAVYLMPQWKHSENPDFDIAALLVAPNQYGYLTSVVGGRGWATGRSRHANFQIYGYPAAALKGEELRSCQAHGLGSDVLTFRFTGPPTLPSLCDMAGGSSGGAWIVEGAYVNGVTSYGYTGSPNKMYSPYFGPEVGSFLSSLP